MPRTDPLITNFSAGELSPKAYGRVDIENYRNGCATLRNMICTPLGPARRRGGTRFIAEVKDSTAAVRLFPFSVGEDRTYIIEAGPLYFRFYTQQGQIENLGVPYEIVTTYTATDLPNMNITQSANVLYIACPNVAPSKLIRASDTSWSITPITFTGTPAEWVAGNYPSVVSIYEQRLIWAATPNEPQTLWASKSANYENLTIGALDDEGYKYTIGSNQVNKIQWMNPGSTLAIGTAGGVFKMSSTSLNEPITPTNVKITRQSPYGCAAIPSVRLGNSVVFVQNGGRKIRTYTYEFSSDAYTAEDITQLSEHITRGEVKEITYQDSPNGIYWAVLKNGLLAGCSLDMELGRFGWHLHNIAGTDMLVESMATVSSELDANYDDVYMVVSRTINSTTKKYVEVMTPGIKDEITQARILDPDETEKDTQQDYMTYMDSCITYEGTPITVMTGLGHLEGELVTVLGDGAVQPSKTVVSGEITLETSASVATAGLGFESMLKTLRIEAEGRNRGTAQGKTKRISKAVVRVDRSLGGEIGCEEFDTMFYGQPPVMGQARPLFSGDVRVDTPTGFNKRGQLTIKQSLPIPLTLVSIMPEVRVQ